MGAANSHPSVSLFTPLIKIKMARIALGDSDKQRGGKDRGEGEASAGGDAEEARFGYRRRGERGGRQDG